MPKKYPSIIRELFKSKKQQFPAFEYVFWHKVKIRKKEQKKSNFGVFTFLCIFSAIEKIFF